MSKTLHCSSHCPSLVTVQYVACHCAQCTQWCSVQHGIGHNSKYLGLPVDTGCHTKSWWTQASHPHTFYTHLSTRVKSKMKTLKSEEKQQYLWSSEFQSVKIYFPFIRHTIQLVNLRYSWSTSWFTPIPLC